MDQNELSLKVILINACAVVVLAAIMLYNVFFDFKDDQEKIWMLMIALITLWEENYERVFFIIMKRNELSQLYARFENFAETNPESRNQDEKQLRIQSKGFSILIFTNILIIYMLGSVIWLLYSFIKKSDEKPYLVAIQIPGTK